jgi:hypothetical protein
MLDMDGVLCDYNSYWGSDKTFDKVRFKSEVINNKMFENLQPLVNGFKLLKSISDYSSDNKIYIDFQILSSLGSPDDYNLAIEVARQKKAWITKYFYNCIKNINLVEHKGKKKWFATPTTILIDDTNQNVKEFIENHGNSILIDFNIEYEMLKESIFRGIDKIQQKINIGIY